jgi:murein DD-endopeptidase MepM/ murein hydrolase activator NlpD
MHRAVAFALVAGSCALVAPGVALAAAGNGGVQAGADTGAAVYDPSRPAPPRPRVRQFAVTPRTLVRGATARLTLRIDGPTRYLRVRVEMVRAGGRRTSLRVNLGRERTGRRIIRAWSPRGSKLLPGTYLARLHAVDTSGQRLRRIGRAQLRVVAPPPPPAPPKLPPAPATPPAPAPATPPAPEPPPAAGGVFPVQGPYSLGNADSRFGAPRDGHVHQGHDVSAAEGTPLVTPLAGVVYWRAYQPQGAGHYLVIRTDAGPDLVFMHLRSGSVTVSKGERVKARQRIAEVGSTGGSGGPHLHFEIWPAGWWSKGSEPIDPFPQLSAWATAA